MGCSKRSIRHKSEKSKDDLKPQSKRPRSDESKHWNGFSNGGGVGGARVSDPRVFETSNVDF